MPRLQFCIGVTWAQPWCHAWTDYISISGGGTQASVFGIQDCTSLQQSWETPTWTLRAVVHHVLTPKLCAGDSDVTGSMLGSFKTPRWFQHAAKFENHYFNVARMRAAWLFVTSWTVGLQAPQSMECSRQEYWSGLPFPLPGDLPHPWIESTSPALAGGFFTTEPFRKPFNVASPLKFKTLSTL